MTKTKTRKKNTSQAHLNKLAAMREKFATLKRDAAAGIPEAVEKLISIRKKQRESHNNRRMTRKKLWDEPPKQSLTDPDILSQPSRPRPSVEPLRQTPVSRPSVEPLRQTPVSRPSLEPLRQTPVFQFQNNNIENALMQQYYSQQQQLQQIQHQINILKHEYELFNQTQQQMMPPSSNDLTENDVQELNSYLSTLK